MKVFRNFIFLSFYPSKMGKSESKPAYQKGTPIPKDPEGILRIFWGFLIPALSVLERLFFPTESYFFIMRSGSTLSQFFPVCQEKNRSCQMVTNRV